MSRRKGIEVPSFVPPLTPIGFVGVRRAPGYSYKKRVAWRYRKVKGKRRRYGVFKKIVVKGRRLGVWFVQPPALKTRWFNVADFQAAAENQKESAGFEVTERDMEIFHSSPADDVIHMTEEVRASKSFYLGTPTLFVWKEPKLPTRLKVFGRKRPFRMVRVWFWVYHNDLEEYRVWCRSSTIFESNFEEAWEFAKKLVEKVEDDIEGDYDYLEVHGMIAWTAYTLGERARRRDKRAIEKESGGTS